MAAVSSAQKTSHGSGTAPHRKAPSGFRRAPWTRDPPEIVRDVHGIAVGGIRLPQVVVPLATNSAIPLGDEDLSARLGGSSVPFGRDEILELYGDRETYVERFEAAAEAVVTAGLVTPREAPGLVIEAGELWDRLVE